MRGRCAAPRSWLDESRGLLLGVAPVSSSAFEIGAVQRSRCILPEPCAMRGYAVANLPIATRRSSSASSPASCARSAGSSASPGRACGSSSTTDSATPSWPTGHRRHPRRVRRTAVYRPRHAPSPRRRAALTRRPARRLRDRHRRPRHRRGGRRAPGRPRQRRRQRHLPPALTTPNTIGTQAVSTGVHQCLAVHPGRAPNPSKPRCIAKAAAMRLIRICSACARARRAVTCPHTSHAFALGGSSPPQSHRAPSTSSQAPARSSQWR